MAPQRNCRWAHAQASRGSAASTAIAGIAVTRWRISAIIRLFTGYSVNGGYAEYASVRADFAFPLPATMNAAQVAPLLCAGIIGYRSLRVAGVERGERVGLYGFGSSASLAIRILQSWGCEVYVVTRGESHRKAAEARGATWVGNEEARASR